VPVIKANPFAALLLSAAALCSGQAAHAQQEGRWIASWTSAQQIPEPQNALPEADLNDATLRQIVHLSLGGAALRVHVSNAFGTQPLHVAAVRVALPSSVANGAIDGTTDRAVLFNGNAAVSIPAGAEMVSDAVALQVAPLSSLAVTLYFDQAPDGETSHPGSRATSFLVHGNLAAAAQLDGATPVEHWFQLSAVDVQAGTDAAALVALGDSITDGHGSTVNGNDRWTDDLAVRLQRSSATQDISVVNAGIGGNRLLLDGLGPNALARFDRDVLAPAGVRSVLVLEGVNDLGTAVREHEISDAAHAALVQRVEGAYEQMIVRAHAHGLRIVGATITPFVGSAYYHPGPRSEIDRQQINAWIRAPGHFDAVADFDAVIRDPAQPDRLLPRYDSGDHLHPSPVGYAAMANAVPLDAILPSAAASHPAAKRKRDH
jgi:lysophospholipase L1-like esterase